MLSLLLMMHFWHSNLCLWNHIILSLKKQFGSGSSVYVMKNFNEEVKSFILWSSCDIFFMGSWIVQQNGQTLVPCRPKPAWMWPCPALSWASLAGKKLITTIPRPHMHTREAGLTPLTSVWRVISSSQEPGSACPCSRAGGHTFTHPRAYWAPAQRHRIVFSEAHT